MKSLGDILDVTSPGRRPGKRRASTKATENKSAEPRHMTRLSSHAAKLSAQQETASCETVNVTDVKGKPLRLVKSQPKQYELFATFLPEDPQIERYSNTIELYDVAPKYFPSRKKMQELRIGEGKKRFLDELVRHFEHRGEQYTLTIHPARIPEKDGLSVEYYPGEAEECVEEALRKIACDNPLSAIYLNNEAGVQFTGYQLQKELKRTGHTMNWPQIWKALQICNGVRLVITDRHNPKDVYLSAPIFPVLAMRNRQQYEANPKDVHCYVQFNPLVTQSLKHLTYRQYDYITCMDIRSSLARWLFRRLSHNYLQASMQSPYQIRLSTIVRDSGMVSTTRRLRDQMRDVETSIKQLKSTGEEDAGILSDARKSVNKGKRGKIEDVLYTLYPHIDFVAQVKKSNRRQGALIGEAQACGLIGQDDVDLLARHVDGSESII